MRGAERLVGAAVLVAALTTAACSAATPAPSRSAASRPSAAAPTPSAAPVQEADDPNQDLTLPSPGKVLLQAAGRTGSEQFAPVPRIDAGTTDLEAACSGIGKVTVDVHGVVSFTLDCGGPRPSENIDSVRDTPLSQVVVSVTSSGTARWALTLGWNDSTATPR